ncbi:tyrosine-protein kinase transmembrane receptor Ror-like isoform X2 [Daktulosphaira vitifoliae]|uniref:tyrosine-protein kinase transmembrane receptor Ror-like isoform X1 n=1 Tax=Daktulosphaira vitifoliae TaxID=58002 RepID=UPI0021A9ACD6|nr:tyrosine-protein kinase transmembrane receptor Ror-like isoform X1 [Daktulosphaira vitifoliae]XP_050525869.1 tyrosine-protein kinase transmembrane receptor Ror-like isoform X2 [Daktulosphaira vitifoliae]
MKRWIITMFAALLLARQNLGPVVGSNTFVDEETNLSSDFLPDDGEPAPNIDEYSSISNYDDYETDTNSSAIYETENAEVIANNSNKSSNLHFVRPLINITRDSGTSVKLRCEVSGEPLPIRIQWYMNEVLVNNEPGVGEKKSKPRISVKRYSPRHKNAMGSRLRINKLEVHDTGFFTCEAFNGVEKIQSNAILKVKMNPFSPHDSSIDVPQFGFSNQLVPVMLDGDSKSNSQLGFTEPRNPLESIPELSQILTYPICQVYQGSLCSKYLQEKSVYIPGNTSQAHIEGNLTSAFKVISHSSDLTPGCEKYAHRSICHTAYPLCRKDRASPKPLLICREDCELLENDICSQEYAIAKKHHLLGRVVPLPNCSSLPETNCFELGIEKPEVNKDETCYWRLGNAYRGTASSYQNLSCVRWSRQLLVKTSDFKELQGGHNYCRNPGNEESEPWCVVEMPDTKLMKKVICEVPHCMRSLQPFIFIVSTISITLFIVLLVMVICCIRKRRKRQNSAIRRRLPPYTNQKQDIVKGKTNGLELSSLIPGSSASSQKSDKFTKVRQYSLGEITFLQEIGEGAFGKVFKGQVPNDMGAIIMVAIKTLKEGASAKTAADFKRETDLMGELRHPNVVCLVGMCARPACLLFEFMAGGDLHEFLMTRSPHSPNSPVAPPLNQADFMYIATQIAAGMEYLCSHHYVHRDLAARNCLVAENLTVKISDFGLSRDIYSSDYYRVQSKSLLPVRWMPPESILYGKFTTESDVWSYGVVLWEVYSYGLQPYYGYSNQEVIEMIRSRQLLPCPQECPSRMYSLMMECWHEAPVRRPNFTEIHSRLRQWAAMSVSSAPTMTYSMVRPSSQSDRTGSSNVSSTCRPVNI